MYKKFKKINQEKRVEKQKKSRKIMNIGMFLIPCGFDRVVVVLFFRCSVFPRQRPCCSGMPSKS